MAIKRIQARRQAKAQAKNAILKMSALAAPNRARLAASVAKHTPQKIGDFDAARRPRPFSFHFSK